MAQATIAAFHRCRLVDHGQVYAVSGMAVAFSLTRGDAFVALIARTAMH
jgi:hypothetical protein